MRMAPTRNPRPPPMITSVLMPYATFAAMRPANVSSTIGAKATCARTHGTLTRRLQALHAMDRLGPSDCFCQNEKVLRSHHGHAYIPTLPETDMAARDARLSWQVYPRPLRSRWSVQPKCELQV